MKDTIRCNKGETNLSGYNYSYWNSWQILIHEMKTDDAEMLKSLLCTFYIEWMTLYDMPCDINNIIADAEKFTNEQLEAFAGSSRVIVPDFRTMPEYNPIDISIEKFQNYVLEWIFHETPEVVRNILDYLRHDMNGRLPKLAASFYSNYAAMKLMQYSIRDGIKYMDVERDNEPSVKELLGIISDFMHNSNGKEGEEDAKNE